MVFLHPWALVGLLALAAPIVIHLLMRREAIRVPFPTLRFLEASRTSAIRRHRLSDIPLLIVRLGALLLAVLALADPLWVSVSRRASAGRVSRAVVIDGSASMDRPAAAGARTLREVARGEAATLQSNVFSAQLIEMPTLRAGIESACDWLARVPASRREVTVLSDFQQGAFEPSMLSCLPADAGLALRRVDAAPQPSIRGPSIRRGASEVVPDIVAAPGSTRVTYVPSGNPPPEMAITTLGDDEERRAAAAALDALIGTGTVTAANDREVSIVFPRAPGRMDIDRRVTPLTAPWMIDAVDRMTRDPVLIGVAADSDAGRPEGRPLRDQGRPIRDQGRPLRDPGREGELGCASDGRCVGVDGASRTALAFAAADGGRLVLFAGFPALSLATPALLQSALASRSAFAYAEREPVTIDSRHLDALGRPSGAPPDSLFRNETSGVGRLLWAAALVALAWEWWIRRRPDRGRSRQEALDERVA